jgi:hypothetical protein
MQKKENQAAPPRVEKGRVYCVICTHKVEAEVLAGGGHARVLPGQKCPRCSSTLDGGYVVELHRAA